MKKKIILSAIMSIVLCVSLIAGATFAIFTSESKVNIAVTSGKVDVSATIDEKSVKSKQLYDEEYTDETHMYQGEAEFTEDGLKLSKFLPGDGIQFNIIVKNNSSVTVKYRTIIGCESDNGLFYGLNFYVNGALFGGSTVVSEYTTINQGSGDVLVSVKVELPEDAGNEYQDTSCTLYFKVEAIQGNAATEDVPTDILAIYSAQDLKNFAKQINEGNLFEAYKEIKLMDDIDLSGEMWKPINVITTGDNSVKWIFNGNGKTISNLTVKGERNVGLFGAATCCTIKDLTVDGANVEGINHVAVIAGDALCTKIENCTVRNAKIVSKVVNNDDGDKAAAIAGYLSAESTAWVKDCVAENIEVSGYRDVGGIVGYANSAAIVTGNKVNGLKLTLDNSVNYKNYTTIAEHDVNPIIGEYNGNKVDEESNTYDNVTTMEEYSEGFKRILGADIYEISSENGFEYWCDSINVTKTVYKNATIKLTADIDYTGRDFTPLHMFGGDKWQNITIDGNGYAIKNITCRNNKSERDSYNLGFISSASSSITIKNIVFDNIVMGNNNYLNMVGVVIGAAYSSVTMDNVTLKNCTANGFGKVGVLIGAMADPGRKVTIKNCSIDDTNKIIGTYDVGGLIGLYLRGENNFEDVTITGTKTTPVVTIIESNGFTSMTDITAAVISCDGSVNTCIGKDVSISGRYILYAGYYYGCYADYYISYGNSSHDCEAIFNGNQIFIANGEICVNAD